MITRSRVFSFPLELSCSSILRDRGLHKVDKSSLVPLQCKLHPLWICMQCQNAHTNQVGLVAQCNFSHSHPLSSPLPPHFWDAYVQQVIARPTAKLNESYWLFQSIRLLCLILQFALLFQMGRAEIKIGWKSFWLYRNSFYLFFSKQRQIDWSWWWKKTTLFARDGTSKFI